MEIWKLANFFIENVDIQSLAAFKARPANEQGISM